jgi:NADH/NAD ratio-sensing transcriptional regulator Rex
MPSLGKGLCAGRISAVLNPDAPIPILHVKNIKDFITTNSIRVAALTVPEPAAQGMVDTLKKTCCKGVINFAPIALKSSDDFLIHNMNIEQEIENLFFNIRKTRPLPPIRIQQGLFCA